MHIQLFADHPAPAWRADLAAQGHVVAVLPIGATPPPAGDAGIVCIATAADLLSARFWLATLTIPTLLVTPALRGAQLLAGRIAAIRVVCRPDRAAPRLAELLQLATEVRAGALVLGPPVAAAPLPEQGERYVPR